MGIRIPNINDLTIAGRVGKDPELRYAQSGMAICQFSIAVDERYKGKDGEWKKNSSWFDVTCFDKHAETVSNTIKRGAAVIVQGKLKKEEWNDKQTNEKRSKVVIISNRVQPLEWPEDGQEGTTREQPPQQQDIPPEDDLPF